MTEYRKKLIEVALPLDAINAESAREKSIRHGHPSTLHLWWARRPLAACRAILFAQLVDDPSAHPEQYPTEEEQDAERERLFRIIEDLVLWENSTSQEVLELARAEIRRSCGGDPPSIFDPFAGGGSIPLEAQRLGLQALASDLNPVAVLINKAQIEIPTRWAQSRPVHPNADNRTQWSRAEGLAEDVRRYGEWMREEAERRIGHLYPKATLPDGSVASVVAWIWARTIACPNPACRARMPLASSFWLSKRKGTEAWVNPTAQGTTIEFSIGTDPGGPPEVPKQGRGAQFRCLACGQLAMDQQVKSEAQSGRMGSQLMAVVAEGHRRRHYLKPSVEHELAAQVECTVDVPALELSTHPQYMSAPRYGMRQLSDLFTPRQRVALGTLSALVPEVADLISRDATDAGSDAPEEYARSVATYLAFSISKLADRHSTATNWYFSRESTSSTFQQQVIPIVWDYAETNPLLSGTGSFGNAVDWVAKAVESLPCGQAGVVTQADARSTLVSGALLNTDPPYYDSVPYADLSDFFYGWLRQSLGKFYPELFATVSTPKMDELVADYVRHGGKDEANKYFEKGFTEVFRNVRSSTPPEFPIVVYYAFRQAERVREGSTSTGWSAILGALVTAGWMVNATWPVRSEASNRVRAAGSNALASSIVIACRPRPDTGTSVDRQGFVRELRREMSGPIRDLQKANIAPVDLRQAAIGPGMAVYSCHKSVIEPDGTPMDVPTALDLINQAVDEILDEQEESFDPLTRWAINWYSQYFFDEGPYGTAEQLAVSMDVSISGLVSSGVLDSGGGRARLVARDELLDSWDPRTDLHTPVWEAMQHLVKRLDSEGEASAARLLRRMPSLGESAQLLAYRLYMLCERSRPALAGPYNALVASWPEIQRLAQAADAPIVQFEQQRFDT